MQVIFNSISNTKSQPYAYKHKVSNPVNVTPVKSKTPFAASICHKNYAIAFFGKKDYTEEEQKFMKLRDNLCEKLHPTIIAVNMNEYIESADITGKAMLPYAQQYEDYYDIMINPKTYKKLESFKDIKDKTLQRHLNYLKTEFQYMNDTDENLNIASDLECSLVDKLNRYEHLLNGKSIDINTLYKLQKTEKSEEQRKKVYSSIMKPASLVEKKVLNLVETRNSYARKNGYDNYYQMILEQEYKTDVKDLFKVIDELEKATDEKAKEHYSKLHKKLAKRFNLKPEELQPYHYNLPEDKDFIFVLDEKVAKLGAKNITDRIYSNMGWDLNKLPIIYDIEPRKNKSKLNTFCVAVDAPNDVRILANSCEDYKSLKELLHESGHAVYSCGISEKLHYLDRKEASTAATEAIAMLIEDLPLLEPQILKKEFNLSESELKKVIEMQKTSSLEVIRTLIRLIKFEKQMYENPKQDLNKLYFELEKELRFRNEPKTPENNWSNNITYITRPGYIQSYLVAKLMGSQIYNALRENLGGPISNNKNVSKFLQEKIFSKGASISNDNILKKITGKSLNVDAFLKRL